MNNNDEPATAPLALEEWQPISPRYATALRLHSLIYAAALLALPHFFPTLPISVWWFTAATVLLFAFILLRWVPRRVRFTRYLMRDLDMHMQTGYWWRNTTSVAINRIQHLEVTQGPLERMLRLSKLVLYTAGGSQSDLKLPGLDPDTAHRLKMQLLHQITQEENSGEAAASDQSQ